MMWWRCSLRLSSQASQSRNIRKICSRRALRRQSRREQGTICSRDLNLDMRDSRKIGKPTLKYSSRCRLHPPLKNRTFQLRNKLHPSSWSWEGSNYISLSSRHASKIGYTTPFGGTITVCTRWLSWQISR